MFQRPADGLTFDPCVSCRKMIADIFGESGEEEEEEFTVSKTTDHLSAVHLLSTVTSPSTQYF